MESKQPGAYFHLDPDDDAAGKHDRIRIQGKEKGGAEKMRVRLDGIVHIGLVTIGVCGVMLGLAIAPWVENTKKILEQGLLILEKRVFGTLHRVRYDPSRWNMQILENREEEEK